MSRIIVQNLKLDEIIHITYFADYLIDQKDKTRYSMQLHLALIIFVLLYPLVLMPLWLLRPENNDIGANEV